MSVFICEDNEVNYSLLELYLQEVGFDDVLWVKSVEEANQQLDEHSASDFECYFIDLMLPDGLGTSIVERLKASERKNVFAYTALNAGVQQDDFVAAGADHVFLKPLTFDSFEKDFLSFMASNSNRDTHV